MLNIALLLALGFSPAQAEGAITPAQAKDYAGKKATVCGVVASASYLEKAKDAPTFLNLDAAYPKHIFTVVIWGKDRKKFGKPEADYLNKKVCVSGKVALFKDIPQIVATAPAQLSLPKAK